MYATEDNLKKRFGDRQIENLKTMHTREGGGETAVQVALQDAEEEINSFIASRYPLPLPNVPSNLNRIACDIARYRLYFDRPTEHVTKLYDDAIAFLRRVQDKKADLPIVDADSKEIIDDQPSTRPSVAPVGTTYRDGVFADSVLNQMPSV